MLDLADNTSAQQQDVREHFTKLLVSFAAQATGSSNRIVRAMLLGDLPSIDSGEITDKGSLNQRAILKNRTADIAALYADPPPSDVIVLTPPAR